MNVQQRFLDCNGNSIGSRKVLFTPVTIPQVTGSFLTTADSYAFTTSFAGVLSASVVANNYKVEFAKPTPATSFYLTVNETGSYVYSGSAVTGSTGQSVSFDLFNLVKDPLSVRKLTLTPTWHYPVTYNASIYLLPSTSSVPDANGLVNYASLVPGNYQVDALGQGTVTTTFFINVPSFGGSWNAKDLLIVKPAKAIKITLSPAYYVLTVSSSDARYVKLGGSINSASYASFAETAATAAHADSADASSVAGEAQQIDISEVGGNPNTLYPLYAIGSIEGSVSTGVDSAVTYDQTSRTMTVTASCAAHALTASYAMNGGSGGGLATGSTYPITASVAGALAPTFINVPNGVAGLDANGDIVATVVPLSDLQANLNSTVLPAGSQAYSTDTRNIYFGDGTSSIANLNPLSRYAQTSFASSGSIQQINFCTELGLAPDGQTTVFPLYTFTTSSAIAASAYVDVRAVFAQSSGSAGVDCKLYHGRAAMVQQFNQPVPPYYAVGNQWLREFTDEEYVAATFKTYMAQTSSVAGLGLGQLGAIALYGEQLLLVVENTSGINEYGFANVSITYQKGTVVGL